MTFKKNSKKNWSFFIPPFCLGDFNTLNPKDYTKDEWSNIVKQRIENGRQPPCHRVIQVNISTGHPNKQTNKQINRD